MDWPSKRIPQGGLFHTPKIQYSAETHELLKLLMEESKLTMMHRKKINYHLRNGEPLPLPVARKPSANDEHRQALDIMRRARIGRRKPLDLIKASGAYDFPKYHPIPNSRNPSDKEKLRLQEFMSGIKMFPDQGYARIKKRKTEEYVTLSAEEEIDEILKEIQERADWLAEMEELGEGKKHRDVIKLQIADRLREIRNLQRKIAAAENINEA